MYAIKDVKIGKKPLIQVLGDEVFSLTGKEIITPKGDVLPPATQEQLERLFNSKSKFVIKVDKPLKEVADKDK